MCCAGLGGVLSLLKERGELEEKVHWAGRANDKKKVALIGLGESRQALDPFLGHQAGQACCLLDEGGWLHCRLQHLTGYCQATVRSALCSVYRAPEQTLMQVVQGRLAIALPVWRGLPQQLLGVVQCTMQHCQRSRRAVCHFTLSLECSRRLCSSSIRSQTMQ